MHVGIESVDEIEVSLDWVVGGLGTFVGLNAGGLGG